MTSVDVLCVGYACYDLIFSVDEHPQADEKVFATDFDATGGGPAANAAISIARLGYKSAFSGYLGHDIYGDKHCQELINDNVNTQLLVRGNQPTPLSSIIVKPNGERSLINYKANQPLTADAVDITAIQSKVMLFDGHQPALSLAFLNYAQQQGITTVLDAGSLHEGTQLLMDKVDYLVCSEKFALQFADTPELALKKLAQISANVVITLWDKGLIWQRGTTQGSLAAFKVDSIDSTGAGDAFHGAFSAAIAANQSWDECLSYASATGALCCTQLGARQGLPSQQEVERLLL